MIQKGYWVLLPAHMVLCNEPAPQPIGRGPPKGPSSPDNMQPHVLLREFGHNPPHAL
jgi:hypothetical protein